MVQFAIIGNRIPYKYFLTRGQGESDAGSKGLPAETGSYDAALNSAGIEDANIVKYTSVIPPGATEISREKGTQSIRWGEVMEAIMAQANGKTGDTISAAVMITSVHNSKGEYIGSFACEYSGSGTENEAKEALGLSISGMIERRGYGKTAPADVGVGSTITTDSGYKYYPGSEVCLVNYECEEKTRYCARRNLFQRVPSAGYQITRINSKSCHKRLESARRGVQQRRRRVGKDPTSSLIL